MVNNDIKKKYKTKIKEFKKHIELYYDKSKPVITDSEFDRLKQEILEIEKNFPSLASKKSISTSVGYKPSKSFEKYKDYYLDIQVKGKWKSVTSGLTPSTINSNTTTLREFLW